MSQKRPEGLFFPEGPLQNRDIKEDISRQPEAQDELRKTAPDQEEGADAVRTALSVMENMPRPGDAKDPIEILRQSAGKFENNPLYHEILKRIESIKNDGKSPGKLTQQSFDVQGREIVGLLDLGKKESIFTSEEHKKLEDEFFKLLGLYQLLEGDAEGNS